MAGVALIACNMTCSVAQIVLAMLQVDDEKVVAGMPERFGHQRARGRCTSCRCATSPRRTLRLCRVLSHGRSRDCVIWLSDLGHAARVRPGIGYAEARGERGKLVARRLLRAESRRAAAARASAWETLAWHFHLGERPARAATSFHGDETVFDQLPIQCRAAERLGIDCHAGTRPPCGPLGSAPLADLRAGERGIVVADHRETAEQRGRQSRVHKPLCPATSPPSGTTAPPAK